MRLDSSEDGVPHTEAEAGYSDDEPPAWVSGYLWKPVDWMQRDAQAFLVEAFPRSLGRRSGMLTFGFQFILDRAKTNLDLLFLCKCLVVFMEYSEA